MLERVTATRDDIPEAVILEAGAIRFRHYLISAHAADRFLERTGSTLSDMISSLNDAVLAIRERSYHVGLRKAFERNEASGGYTLKNGNAFFFVQIDKVSGHHVIATVMTTWTMVSSYYQKKALHHTH